MAARTSVTSPSRELSKLLRQGMAQFDAGQLEASRHTFERVLHAQQDQPGGGKKRGSSTRWLMLTSVPADALLQLGIVHLLSNEFAAAADMFSRVDDTLLPHAPVYRAVALFCAVRLISLPLLLLLFLMFLLMQQGDYDAALPVLRRARDMQEPDALLETLLGNCLAEMEDFDGAEAHLLAACRRDPELLQARADLGLV
jgi:tetratricopeptide (TPR) repeat protein